MTVIQHLVAVAHRGALPPRQEELPADAACVHVAAWLKQSRWGRLYFHRRRAGDTRKTQLALILARHKKSGVAFAKTALREREDPVFPPDACCVVEFEVPGGTQWLFLIWSALQTFPQTQKPRSKVSL